jgi:hypothetical protein
MKVVKGVKYETLIGSRAQVMHGTAYKTSGGLIKKDLFQNKNGRIVSRKKHELAKKEKRLLKAGYGTRKGHFGAVKLHSRHHKSSRSSRRRRRSMRGGMNGPAVQHASTAQSVSDHSVSADGATGLGSGSGVAAGNFLSVPSNVTNMSNSATWN